MKKFFLFMLVPFFVNAHETLGMSLHIHSELLMALILISFAAIFFIKKYFSKV
tara:strand:- start:244 stop:402 length:159 start_codon:yes stop_codon:yes gene_type:complete